VASADQVKALIRSHAEGDDERFYSVAMQAAAQEARSGHGLLAQELRELVDRAKAKAAAQPAASRSLSVPLVQPQGELAGLLAAAYPRTRLDDMVLDDAIRERLDNVVLEQRQQSRLAEHGLSPIRKLLLVGPPGVGKKMSAAGLAGELGLPMFSPQLDGLITKFMGETAANLRIVFEAIQLTLGVYLFDEFDALWRNQACFELVLVLLEHDDSNGLVIATTNHPTLIDRAIYRRFDSVIEYTLPTSSVAETIMRARLAFLNSDQIEWAEAAKATEGLSHADITRACEQASKSAILNHSTVVDTSGLIGALNQRRGAHR